MSTGVGMSACCLSGTIASGTPKGREETIGGLPTYVAEPADGSKAKTIVVLSDVFGWQLPNTRLAADTYSSALGCTVYLPDLHSGTSLPADFLNAVEPPLSVQAKLTTLDKAKNTATVAATLGPWLISHREAVSRPIIEGFIRQVKTIPGTNKVGALGFCWGGRYALLAAGGGGEGLVDAAVAAHPSLLAVPGDLEGISKPVSVALGDRDGLVDAGTRGGIQDALAKKTDVEHEMRVYEGMIHGFALRGDWSSEAEKRAMDEVTSQGVEWFGKYLA